MRYRYLFAIIMIFLPSVSFGNIALSQNIIQFDSGQKHREDIEVFNRGTEKVYLTIQVFEVKKPGEESQERVKVLNPRSAGLLVSPRRTAMASGARQVVRFVNLNKRSLAKDKIYRVTVTPTVGSIAANQSAVKVIIAYEVLVIVRPRNASPQLITERRGKQLILKNTGNSNLLLRKGKQCPVGEDILQCEQLPGKRLYAGNTWQVTMPFQTPVLYTLTIGNQNVEKLIR